MNSQNFVFSGTYTAWNAVFDATRKFDDLVKRRVLRSRAAHEKRADFDPDVQGPEAIMINSSLADQPTRTIAELCGLSVALRCYTCLDAATRETPSPELEGYDTRCPGCRDRLKAHRAYWQRRRRRTQPSPRS